MTAACLQTGRLKLTPLSLAQLTKILNNDPLESALGMPAAPGLISPPVLKALEIKITRMQSADEQEHPWFTFWLMTPETACIGIGLLGFKGAPDTDGQVEIGYGITARYEGRGYTTEAVQALVKWALAQPGCTTVTAETRKDNTASQRVLVKAGFQQQDADEELLYWARPPK